MKKQFFSMLKRKQLQHIILAITVLIISPLSGYSQWVSFDKNNVSEKPPQVQLISHDKNATVIKIDLHGFYLQSVKSGSNEFQKLDLLTDIFTTKAGSPEIPYTAKILAVPDQAAISYEVIEVGEIYTYGDILLPPARISQIEGAPEPAYVMNKGAYTSDNIYPSDFVHIDNPSVFRDFRIARVSVFPVRYSPASHEVQIASSLTVKIKYGKGEVINPKTSPKRAIAPSFGALYRTYIFNYQDVLDSEYGGREEGEEVLLYITPDDFAATLEPYLEWKRLRGYKVILTKFSDISATATNPNTIKNHVSDLYHFSQFPPTYVIMIGDHGYFPHKTVTHPSYSFPDEDFFVKVDGTDIFPDAFVGRIPIQTVSRLEIIQHKKLLYERTPYMNDPDWFRKGLCCSNNAYASQVETKRFAAEKMLVDGNFLSVDTLMSSNPCTMNLNDIIAAINDGRSFLNYRGEGWSSGWWANCYPFNTSSVSNNVLNGEKFLFITSIGCGVSMFNTSGGNSWSEQWLKLGTMTEPRGAIAVIGAVSNSHTAPNNRIDRGIYMGMFEQGMATPGQANLSGKMFLYQEFGTDPQVEYHFNVFAILGDPSINIWKTTPKAILSDHPDTIYTGTTGFDMIISYQSNNLPVKNANIHIQGNSFTLNEKTDLNGLATIESTFSVVDTLLVTITGEDILPYYDTIFVSTTSISVEEFESSSLTLHQNQPNPFETGTVISYSLKKPAEISLVIYDMKGNIVKTLINEHKNTGLHNVTWDGCDDSGRPLMSGTYLCRLQNETETKTIRMMKIR
jgi:hypothetical protein